MHRRPVDYITSWRLFRTNLVFMRDEVAKSYEMVSREVFYVEYSIFRIRERSRFPVPESGGC